MFVQPATASAFVPAATDVAQTLIIAARNARGTGLLEQSLSYYRAGLKLIKELNPPAAANLSLELSSFLITLGFYCEAESVLEMYASEHYASESASKFSFDYLEAISSSRLLQCKFEEAETGLRKAVSIAEQIADMDQQCLVNTKLLLCIALAEQKKNLDEAETICLSILSDLATDKILGANPYALQTLCKLMLTQKNYELAESLGEQCLKQAEVCSLESAWALAHLAETCKLRRKLTESIEFFHRSLDTIGNLVGSFHHLYGTVSLNLAKVLIEHCQYSQAAEHLQHACLVFEMAKDADSAKLGITLLRLCSQSSTNESRS